MSPVEFRHRFNAHLMAEHFRTELVLPHLEVLRCFRPVNADPAWARPAVNFRPAYSPSAAKVAERTGR
jgi:hypothetical protein